MQQPSLQPMPLLLLLFMGIRIRLAPVLTLTPEMVQQMIVSTFSALGLSGKAYLPSSPWYFDSGASNHMTNNVAALTNVTNYSDNLQIHTVDGNNLPITTIGDISSSLTLPMFMFPLISPVTLFQLVN